MANKVAVVTGPNKGIGYAMVKELLERGVQSVYLTARDVNRGKEAVEKLKNEGLNPLFHQLEVTDKDSVKALAEHLKAKHGGLDILVNNAAVTTKDFYETTYEDAKRVLDTNYKGIIFIQDYLFPILKDNARVINISSSCGHLSNIRNRYWIERLSKKDIKCEDADAFADWFLDSVKNGTINKDDFSETSVLAYRVAKVALAALTRAQQNVVERGISVNSQYPGFVPTDMTHGHGDLPLAKAGKTTAYLALDADQSIKGKFFWYDGIEREWTDVSQNLARTVLFEKALKDAGVI